MRLLLAMWFVVAAAGMARADDPPPLDAAVKQAAAAGKPLLIEFHATWCGPCKQFESTVLPDPRVQKALETVMFVEYDVDKSPGTEASAKLASGGVPEFVTVDANGIARARKTGGMSADDFIKFVVNAGVMTLDQKSVDALLKKKPNDPQARMEIAGWYAQQRRSSEAIGQWQRIANDKTAPAELRQEAARNAARTQRIDAWRHDLSADQVAQIRGDLRKVDVTLVAAALIGSPLSDREKTDLLKQVLDAQTDMDSLNSLAYVALAAHANDLALAAATKVVAARRDAQRLDTLAECNHALGNTTEALALEDEALRLATGGSLEPLLRANRKRFETGADPAPDAQKYEARAQALWKQVDDADRVPDAARTPPAGYAAAMAAARQQRAATSAYFDSVHTAANGIEMKCRPLAAKSEMVVARFDVSSDGHITNINLLTDTAATKALRKCIESDLAAQTLAPPPPKWPTRESMTFNLR